MVHFDFVVSDDEAKAIFDCLELEIEDCEEEMVTTGKDEIEDKKWLLDRKGFISALKGKMKSYSIDERAVG